MLVKFHKMSGAGNDFVLISGRAFASSRLKDLAAVLCARKTGVGADGLLYAAKKNAHTVSVRYFNADGSEAFCGNGSRCAAWWAHVSGTVRGRKFDLATAMGVLSAEVMGPERIKMRMPDVPVVCFNREGKYPEPVRNVHYLNTGVPHAVVPLRNIVSLDVDALGRGLRYNKAFGPAGANVDFVTLRGRDVFVRTYERGVEAETLACGTGITAGAIALGIERGLPVPVRVTARSGGRFKVWFKAGPDGSAGDIYIEGPAALVFEGRMEV